MKRFQTAEVQSFETEHIKTVRTLAPECAVLLKNEGILPLAGPGKIALYGSGARRTIKGGTGSGDVNVRHFVTIEEGLKNAGFEITTGAWLDGYDDVMNCARASWIEEIRKSAHASGVNPIFAAMGKVMPEPEYELPLDGESDTAVYVLSRISGEGNDRQAVAGDIDLTETEIRDILALNAKYPKFVLVLNVGGMVNLAPVEDVKAILLLSQLGTPTGDVCADLLLGKSFPSGKLTMSWAPIDKYPSTEGFGDINDTRYREGVFVGYRYFDTFRREVTYPFGFGLGYTSFDLETKDVTADAKQVAVTVSVKNIGERAGKEAVQVYVSAPSGNIDKPLKELKAFGKTEVLRPGEIQELTLRFATASMASFDQNEAGYVLEKGAYIIRIGTCSACTEPVAAVILDREAVTYKVRRICPGCDFEDLKPPAEERSGERDAEEKEDVGKGENRKEADTCGSELPDGIHQIRISAEEIPSDRAFYRGDPQEIPLKTGEDFHEENSVSWQDVKDGKLSIDQFLAGLNDRQLADLCIGNYSKAVDGFSVIGQACSTVAGGAGETTGHLDELKLDRLSMADGPAGLRLNKEYKIVDGVIKGQDSALAGMFDFLDEEELAKMASMLPKPSEAERLAPICYQFCTAIPIGTALAQSFNTELCEEIGSLVGEEMEIFGVDLWLAPALNIMRSPLCGRNFEYYSEDPLVSGKTAAAITRGVQKHSGRGATIKHFAANNQESNRYGSNSIVSERALREIYLRGFEIAVTESSPEAVMTSYNLINGEHTCSSRDLNTHVLRDEWGYQGLVMTDWLVTRDLMINPAGAHGKASSAGCVRAGNHLIMPGGREDQEDILEALRDETHPYHLTRANLQDAAKQVLLSIRRLTEAN